MRLNFSNIGRGIEAIADAKKAQDLARVSAQYDVTEGAYGTGLAPNLQQVIGARDEALQGLGEQATPEQRQQVLDQYTPAMSELSRRVGLTAPDYSVASGPTNFATRQEARQAAAPMRAEGLAGVYRQYGDVNQADALEARAFEQQRALAREGRDIAREGREAEAGQRAQQEFATRQTLTGLQIADVTRTQAANQRQDDFSNFAAENPNATTQELKDAAFKQFKFTPKQWQDTVTTRLGIENAEMDSFKNGIKKKLQGKNLTQLGSLYNSDPDFDDKTDLAIVPGKGGAVTLNFIDKATKKITGTQTFKNDAQAVEYLNRQATEPETIGSWMLNLGKTEAAIDASKAASAASASTSGLNAIRGNLVNRQIKDLDETAINTKEAKKLMDDFSALTEAEQNGPKGRALEKQYNMLVAKPGAQLRVSPEGKAPRAMDEVEKVQLEAYNKWIAEPRNARLPSGEKDAMADTMGVSHLLRTVRARAAESSGGVTLGGDAYTTDREKESAPAPATPPAKQGLTKTSSAPALNTGNTKLLGRAGNSGYSVEMPDGTTRVMSISELNKLGYQFLGGNTGLERPWYDDLLPRR
jgi:hypothetical protein